MVVQFLQATGSLPPAPPSPTAAAGSSAAAAAWPSWLSSLLGWRPASGAALEAQCGGARGQEAAEQFAAPEVLRRVATCAQQVAVACVLRRWPALLQLVLPAVTAGGVLSPEEAAAAMDACLAPEDATLLHAAVGAGCVEVSCRAVEWGPGA